MNSPNMTIWRLMPPAMIFWPVSMVPRPAATTPAPLPWIQNDMASPATKITGSQVTGMMECRWPLRRRIILPSVMYMAAENKAGASRMEACWIEVGHHDVCQPLCCSSCTVSCHFNCILLVSCFLLTAVSTYTVLLWRTGCNASFEFSRSSKLQTPLGSQRRSQRQLRLLLMGHISTGSRCLQKASVGP